MVRSILAIIAGFVCAFGTIIATDFSLLAVLPKTFAEGGPGTAVLVALLGAYAVGSALGGYVAAFVAGRSEIKHSLTLGLVFLALGLASVVCFKLMPQPPPGSEAAAEMQPPPLWFGVATLVQVVPVTVLGGCLRVWQKLCRPGHSA